VEENRKRLKRGRFLGRALPGNSATVSSEIKMLRAHVPHSFALVQYLAVAVRRRSLPLNGATQTQSVTYGSRLSNRSLVHTYLEVTHHSTLCTQHLTIELEAQVKLRRYTSALSYRDPETRAPIV
jgi:hypothetical protein